MVFLCPKCQVQEEQERKWGSKLPEIVEPPKEGWFKFLRTRERFGEVILLAWSAIEFNIDISFLVAFGVLPKLEGGPNTWITFKKDEKVRLLLGMHFNKKIEFLNQVGRIQKNENKALGNFQKDRNRLFHGREPPFIYLSDEEKETVMDRADEAMSASFAISLRMTESR